LKGEKFMPIEYFGEIGGIRAMFAKKGEDIL
jgi:hypothetical protein